MKTFKYRQNGFSLFMVMIIMLVIALLVVVTSQLSSTEMRISTNEADRKYAMSLAENGLREAESMIGTFPNRIKENNETFTFFSDCTAGFCAASEDVPEPSAGSGYVIKKNNTALSKIVAWKRKFRGSSGEESVFDANNRHRKIENARTQEERDKVSYIIEFLGERPVGARTGRYFRVTVRAKGQNENTAVTLQSHIEMVN